MCIYVRSLGTGCCDRRGLNSRYKMEQLEQNEVSVFLERVLEVDQLYKKSGALSLQLRDFAMLVPSSRGNKS